MTSLIESKKSYLGNAGMSSTLWYKHREAWEAVPEEDRESEERPHPPQLLAAMTAFLWMYVGAVKRAWVHVAAEFQAGKSGVVAAVIRLVLANAVALNMRPDSIFVLTGMSDDAWKKQTRNRMPKEIRHNVHHSGGLKKIQEKLYKLAARDGLRNVLVFVDESQVASTTTNRPNKLIYGTLRELAPVEEWAERNIRVVTVSATDPAKVMMMKDSQVPCHTVRLFTTDAYQSVEKLRNADRIRPLEVFGDIGSKESMPELVRAVAEYETPMWHILRPRIGKHAEVEAKLRQAFPDPETQIVRWDASASDAAADEDDSSTVSLKDINELLSKKPTAHSFVLLKNMFYAGKTLDDRNVGLLWDRLGGGVGGDNARLQSLLGRACGYKKSSRTVVYTSLETVDRYLGFWQELCHSVEAETVVEGKATAVHRRMPGVFASAASNDTSTLSVSIHTSTPFSGTQQGPLTGGASSRVTVDEDGFEVSWHEFATLAEAKAFAPHVGKTTKQDEDGFFLSSTTGKVKRLSYADVRAMRGGKKTAGFGNAKKLEPGQVTHTFYPCYRDLSKTESVVFVVGRLTRKKD